MASAKEEDLQFEQLSASETRHVFQLPERSFDVVRDCRNIQEADIQSSLARYSLEESVHSRYFRTVFVNSDETSITSYCYLSDEHPADENSMHPVTTGDLLFFLLQERCRQIKIARTASDWMQLSAIGKAQLHRILRFPQDVSPCIEWIKSETLWKLKPFLPDLQGMRNVHVMTNYYGDPKGKKFETFTQRVMDGLSQEQMKPMKHPFLADSWTAALIAGLGNGDGRTAVYGLFDEIVNLLPQMNITTPVRVFHKTSPSKKDSSATSPKITKPETHTQLSDLVVLTQDQISGLAKYACLVAIQSKGKTEKTEFLKELIWALQSQNIVFGFLFSAEKVTYYCAERDTSGAIEIESFFYSLPYATDESKVFTLSIGYFQMLIMDILACLVFGVKYIDV